MWCAGCQQDVAGEFSPDGQSLVCATCGGDLTSAKTPSLHPQTREIRQLLDRWSTEELLDPDLPLRFTPPPVTAVRSDSPHGPAAQTDGSAATVPTTVGPAPLSSANEQSGDPEPRRVKRPKFRLDAEHTPKIGSTAPVPPPHPRRAAEPHPQMRFDSSHLETPAPHFNIESAFEGKKRPGAGESLWGQILAYGGILLLTLGTVMVVSGYFGGRPDLAPTGWLLASAGQMMLFLGVVTLVSGGMEQTTHEVSRRIEILGNHLLRFERHAEEQLLRGPHFAAQDEPARRRRQTADAHERDGDDE